MNTGATSKLLLSIGVLVCLLGQPGAHGATYYKWIDEKGSPVHSDRPPPHGIEYEEISAGQSRRISAEANVSASATSEDPAEAQGQAAAAEYLQVTKKNPEFCQRARDNLVTLDSAARIRIKDSDGEYRFLSDEEKEAQRAKARDAIAVHCD